MNDSEPHLAEGPDRSIRRRRAILYAVVGIVLAALVVVAIAPRGDRETRPRVAEPPKEATILARIKLRAVDGSASSGIAEVLRRGEDRSLRVLAVKLPPNKEDEAYQLVLTGGAADERLLGTAVVGSQRVFVGEAKLSGDELERHRRIELRRVTRKDPPTAKTILRGRIPR